MTTAQSKDEYFPRIFIKGTPTSLLDPFGSRLPVGLDYHFSARWAVAVEVSIPFMSYPRDLYENDNNQRIKSDLRVRLDGKYFISQNHRAYIGTEFFWRNQELGVSNGYYEESVSGGFEVRETHFATAEVYKNMFGGGFILGSYARISSRVYIEPYFGIGVRHFAVHRLNIESPTTGRPQRAYFDYSFGLLQNEDKVEGEHTTPYLPMGLKINIAI